MTAVLVFTQGPLTGQRLEPEGELVIGREGAALTIEDSELSRRHAAVRPVEGGIEIEDLGSLNGTFVNGQRIDCADPACRRRFGQARPERPGARSGGRARDGHVSRSRRRPPRRRKLPTPAASGVPSEPFGTYAAPEGMGRRRGIASRQLLPMLASWAAVAGTADRAGDLLREPLSPIS